MKNLFLTCVVLFLVFTIGCQESSITDPTQPLDKNDIGAVNHNIIGLHYRLTDPSGGSSLLLAGQVSFDNSMIPSIADDGRLWVKVVLGMTAQLSRTSEIKHSGSETRHPVWKIEQKTVDKVVFDKNRPVTLGKRMYKTYSITNRTDVELCVAYLISLKSVRVAEVFFSRIED